MKSVSSILIGGIALGDIWRQMRPRQWVKNVVVLAAFFFALGDKQQNIPFYLFFLACLAALLFAITSSGIYTFNDLKDIALDRLHPVKRMRPVAAGKISVPEAKRIIAACLAIGLGGAWLLSARFGMVLSIYVVLQLAYCLKLKHIHLVDVFIIAAGFVLRAIAGGVVINVHISPWLLICTFLVALFLALCKRRHERHLLENQQVSEVRPSLNLSDVRLLDQLIAVTAGAVIVTYAIYTQSPETVLKFGTTHLSFTIPFVVFGLFRYLDLVYRQSKGDQPEYTLLTDAPLLITIALFGLSVLLIVIL